MFDKIVSMWQVRSPYLITVAIPCINPVHMVDTLIIILIMPFVLCANLISIFHMDMTHTEVPQMRLCTHLWASVVHLLVAYILQLYHKVFTRMRFLIFIDRSRAFFLTMERLHTLLPSSIIRRISRSCTHPQRILP